MSLFTVWSKSKIEEQIRKEMMPILIAEAKEQALKEIEQEERMKGGACFVVSAKDDYAQDVHKLARVIRAKISDYKQERGLLQLNPNDANLKLQHEKTLTKIKRNLEKHVASVMNECLTLDDYNLDCMRNYTSLELSNNGKTAVVSRMYLRKEEFCRTLNSLKYVYKTSIKMYKHGNKARAFWSVEIQPVLIADDKELNSLIPPVILEKEFTDEVKQEVDFLLTYPTTTSAKFMVLDIILSATFSSDNIVLANLSMEGSIDQIVYGKER